MKSIDYIYLESEIWYFWKSALSFNKSFKWLTDVILVTASVVPLFEAPILP